MMVGMVTGAAPPDPRRWRALAGCLTALAMTLVDATVVNVALPSIGAGLGARPSELLWVVSGYGLAFGMVPVLGGRLGDDLGRRRLLLIGIGAFVVTSAAVGLAPTTPVLVAARVCRGSPVGSSTRRCPGSSSPCSAARNAAGRSARSGPAWGWRPQPGR